VAIHDIAELWVTGYVRAWNSSKPDDIARLFTEDAVYYPRPHPQPWRGRDLIVRERAEKGSGQSGWTFT
jgi:hypothetical protein